MFHIIEYIKHFFAKNRIQNIDSLFVKRFIEIGVKGQVLHTFMDGFLKTKRNLINNHSIIEVSDLGAGSRKINSNKRVVSTIVKNAGISKTNAYLLHNLISNYKIYSILEIGTSVGLGTFCLANNKNVAVTTLEGCKNTLAVAKENLKKNSIENVNFVLGDFDETLEETIKGNKYDLIYFDGNHQKEPTINYFEQCLESAHEESIFIFDDIYWSKEMLEAWNYIKNHSKVTFTIDTYYWGIVFFRKEKEKKHYKIKL